MSKGKSFDVPKNMNWEFKEWVCVLVWLLTGFLDLHISSNLHKLPSLGLSFYTCKIKAGGLEFLGSLPAQTGCDSVSLVVRDIHGYYHENYTHNGITKWTKLEMTIGYF